MQEEGGGGSLIDRLLMLKYSSNSQLSRVFQSPYPEAFLELCSKGASLRAQHYFSHLLLK